MKTKKKRKNLRKRNHSSQLLFHRNPLKSRLKLHYLDKSDQSLTISRIMIVKKRKKSKCWQIRSKLSWSKTKLKKKLKMQKTRKLLRQKLLLVFLLRSLQKKFKKQDRSPTKKRLKHLMDLLSQPSSKPFSIRESSVLSKKSKREKQQVFRPLKPREIPCKTLSEECWKRKCWKRLRMKWETKN